MDRSNQRKVSSHGSGGAGLKNLAGESDDPQPKRPGAQAAKDRLLTLSAVGLGTLVVPLDSSVNIAFPFITEDFGLPIDAIQWIVICYVLTLSSLMLVFGKLGDLFGHRRIFQIGLAGSVLAFLFCAAAPSFGWLLPARVIQGIGAALIISCGPALTIFCFPESRRARALGLYTGMFGLGAVMGPSLGGILVDNWNWSAVFWFRIPISLLALLITFAMPSPQRPAKGRSFDLRGGVLLAVALGSLLLTLNQLQRPEAAWPAVLALAALTAIGSAGFVIHELRVSEPIIHPEVFRNVDFVLLNLANFLVNLAGFSVMLLVPFYLSWATGYSTMLSGLILAAAPLGMALAGPAGGGGLGSFRPDRIAFLAIMLVVTGLAMVSTWDDTTTIAFMAVAGFIQGTGLGLFQVYYSHIVTGMLPPRDRGVAGSLVMVTRSTGIVAGAAVLSWMFTSALDDSGAFLPAFQATFRNAALLLALFFGLTLLRPRLWLGPSGRH